MVEVTEEKGFNNVETDADGRFKSGLGGFLCSCTKVEGGGPCEFPDRDIIV
jgi:hypothetical protein